MNWKNGLDRSSNNSVPSLWKRSAIAFTAGICFVSLSAYLADASPLKTRPSSNFSSTVSSQSANPSASTLTGNVGQSNVGQTTLGQSTLGQSTPSVPSRTTTQTTPLQTYPMRSTSGESSNSMPMNGSTPMNGMSHPSQVGQTSSGQTSTQAAVPRVPIERAIALALEQHPGKEIKEVVLERNHQHAWIYEVSLSNSSNVYIDAETGQILSHQ